MIQRSHKLPAQPLGDIAALDTARFADGAASPAVERANDALEAEMRSWRGDDGRADAELRAGLVTAFDDERGQIARQLRTSDEPTARASSRIPDVTGREDITATGPENKPVGAPELDAAQDAFAMRRGETFRLGII